MDESDFVLELLRLRVEMMEGFHMRDERFTAQMKIYDGDRNILFNSIAQTLRLAASLPYNSDIMETFAAGLEASAENSATKAIIARLESIEDQSAAMLKNLREQLDRLTGGS